jgi:hypothetical protein
MTPSEVKALSCPIRQGWSENFLMDSSKKSGGDESIFLVSTTYFIKGVSARNHE